MSMDADESEPIDLVQAVPVDDDAASALATTLRMGIASIPVVGPAAIEAIGHVMNTRQQRRDREFDRTMAAALQDVIDRTDGAITSVSAVVDTDEFVAAVNRARRIAQETVSEAKRARLASGVANGVPCAGFSFDDRARFRKLAEELDDLHVWLLRYLDHRDGRTTLRNSEGSVHAPDDTNPLCELFGRPFAQWWEPYARCVAELQAESLVGVPVRFDRPKEVLPPGAIVPARWASREDTLQLGAYTKERGRRFLEFVRDPSSVESPPIDAFGPSDSEGIPGDA